MFFGWKFRERRWKRSLQISQIYVNFYQKFLLWRTWKIINLWAYKNFFLEDICLFSISTLTKDMLKLIGHDMSFNSCVIYEAWSEFKRSKSSTFYAWYNLLLNAFYILIYLPCFFFLFSIHNSFFSLLLFLCHFAQGSFASIFSTVSAFCSTPKYIYKFFFVPLLSIRRG